MSKFQHMVCLVCNQRVDPGDQGFGLFQAFGSPSKDASAQPRLAPRYLVHDECAHRVAHPDFDFAAVARAHEEVERIFATAPVRED
jgi:hypothetical protein